jgi:His-Xaa-Ser system protein HxsD
MISKNYIKDNEIVVYADNLLYSKETLLKCLYWYGDKFNTVLELENNSFKLIISPTGASNIKQEDLPLYQQKLERDIIDFHLRDIVNKETANIRDLLIAKAFSNGEFDELPPGVVSDPVGFNPNL